MLKSSLPLTFTPQPHPTFHPLWFPILLTTQDRPHGSTSLYLSYLHPMYPSISLSDASPSGLLQSILMDHWGGLLHTWGFSGNQFPEALSDEAPAGSPMDTPYTLLFPPPHPPAFCSCICQTCPYCHVSSTCTFCPRASYDIKVSAQMSLLSETHPQRGVSWTGMTVHGFLFPPFPPLPPKYKSWQRKLLAHLVYSKSLVRWLLTKYLLNSLTKIIVKSFFWHCVIN